MLRNYQNDDGTYSLICPTEYTANVSNRLEIISYQGTQSIIGQISDKIRFYGTQDYRQKYGIYIYLTIINLETLRKVLRSFQNQRETLLANLSVEKLPKR